MTQSNHVFATGQKVRWHWGQHIAKGEVEQVHKRRVTKTIKGTRVTRNASAQHPAYTIKQTKGMRTTHVLKSHTELHETN